jgi:hypothetical protein
VRAAGLARRGHAGRDRGRCLHGGVRVSDPLLLALDLSSNVGWAMFRSGRPPRFGTLEYGGQGKARIIGKFGDWLSDMHSVEPWQGLAWERPLLTPKDTVDKLEILYGLVGVAYAFAGSRRHPMPHLEVDVPTVKKRLTGKARAEKPEVIEACWKLGWKVGTDHEADACGVGLCAYRRMWPT